MDSYEKRYRAFTLIEIIAVIAIIGILASILTGSISSVMHSARKVNAANNLHQIALAYYNYSRGNARPKTIVADSIYDWALVLAKYSDFNNASAYYLNEDPWVEIQVERPQLVGRKINGNWSLDSHFENCPLSFCVVSGLASLADEANTPIAWTRGLNTDGTWDSEDGVYGDEGGHIVFLDGHVEYYESLTDESGRGRLIHYSTKAETNNIYEAISPGAKVLSYSKLD